MKRYRRVRRWINFLIYDTVIFGFIIALICLMWFIYDIIDIIIH